MNGSHTAERRDDLSFPASEHRRQGRKTVALLLVVILVVGGTLTAVLISRTDDESSGETFSDIGIYDDTTAFNDSAHHRLVYAGGDFYSTAGAAPVLTLTFETNWLRVTLTDRDGLFADGTTFQWTLSGESAYRTQTTAPKAYPNTYTQFDYFTYGDYNLSVVCRTADGTVYRFAGDLASLVCREWEYQGDVYRTAVAVSYDDYVAYRDLAGGHLAPPVWNAAVFSDYIFHDSAYGGTGAPDPSVTALLSSLDRLYTQRYGTAPAADQAYADFILACVQGIITYQYDYQTNHAGDYWSYPAETLYLGVGDCEDTSILCCALFACAGFQTGLCVLQNHVVAGVVLSEYLTPSQGTYEEGGTTYQLSPVTQCPTVSNPAGLTYYCCETTAESFIPVGLEPSSLLVQLSLLGKVPSEGRNYSFYQVFRQTA